MDDGLKQRLVGALVLVAVGVIFLPSLLSQESRRIDTTTQIPVAPPTPSVRIEVPPEPVVDQPLAEPEAMYQLIDEADTVPEESGLDEAGIPKGWVVQVASFDSKDKAEALRDRLLADGYKAFIRAVELRKGQAVRVFVGPKLDKQAAITLKQELDSSLKVESILKPFAP